MINHETELKLQAYLDGELPAAEKPLIQDLITRNPEARSLVEELEAARRLLAGNEPEWKVAESREFYWSKIRRQIEAEEGQRAAREVEEPVPSWWARLLAPAGVLGVLALFIGISLRTPEDPSGLLALEDGHEIETPLEETSSFSFRSEAAAMTVVWVDSHRE